MPSKPGRRVAPALAGLFVLARVPDPTFAAVRRADSPWQLMPPARGNPPSAIALKEQGATMET